MVMELDCSCAIFIKETEYQYGQGDGLASGLEIGLEIEVGSRLGNRLENLLESLVQFGPWSRPGCRLGNGPKRGLDIEV